MHPQSPNVPAAVAAALSVYCADSLATLPSSRALPARPRRVWSTNHWRGCPCGTDGNSSVVQSIEADRDCCMSLHPQLLLLHAPHADALQRNRPAASVATLWAALPPQASRIDLATDPHSPHSRHCWPPPAPPREAPSPSCCCRVATPNWAASWHCGNQWCCGSPRRWTPDW